MKCPKCGKEARDPILYCDYCHNEQAMVDLLDPAVMLDLIEKAILYRQSKIEIWSSVPTEHHIILNVLQDFKSYLCDDHEPLKKLAGEKEESDES